MIQLNIRKSRVLGWNRVIEIKRRREEASGIVYVEDTFRIEIGENSNNIGLLIKEDGEPVKLKSDVQELDLSATLEAA